MTTRRERELQGTAADHQAAAAAALDEMRQLAADRRATEQRAQASRAQRFLDAWDDFEAKFVAEEEQLLKAFNDAVDQLPIVQTYAAYRAIRRKRNFLRDLGGQASHLLGLPNSVRRPFANLREIDENFLRIIEERGARLAEFIAGEFLDETSDWLDSGTGRSPLTGATDGS